MHWLGLLVSRNDGVLRGCERRSRSFRCEKIRLWVSYCYLKMREGTAVPSTRGGETYSIVHGRD